jgi:hypothetical protein
MADRVIYVKNGSVSNITHNAHPLAVEQLEW